MLAFKLDSNKPIKKYIAKSTTNMIWNNCLSRIKKKGMAIKHYYKIK